MRPKSEKGQAMVEFALLLPILLLILSGIINFGWIFGNQLLANNVSREAARYTAIHYYDSLTDDDRLIAEEIVAERAPTLVSPVVTLVKSATGDSITVNVVCSVNLLTPLMSAMFPDGKYSVVAQCSMRLE
ncbi:MAG: hypothetical protein EOM51_03330 [Clostridia bacterium]|nr:hypothetical protein [Clostridia bacterium]